VLGGLDDADADACENERRQERDDARESDGEQAVGVERRE
jgi:hypothetical protein